MGRREILIDFSLSTSISFSVFYIFSCLWVQPCAAAASILYATQSLRDGQTLGSTNNLFELGFFSPPNSQKRYLGIWCPDYSSAKAFWVANRENPLEDKSGILTIQENGNLAVVNGSNQTQVFWSTSVSLQSNVTIAVIMDTGNFELKEGNSTDAATVWESFNHPSDTIFPGMKLGINRRTGETNELRSWKSSEDPTPGNFAFGIDPDGLDQFFIWRRSVPYWRSVFWNGTAYDVMVHPFSMKDLVNFSIINDEDGVYFMFESPSPSVMLVMDHAGTLNRLEMTTGGSISTGPWTGDQDPCSMIGSCGRYTSCNVNNRPRCKCLPGFKRNSGTWTDGCGRMTQLSCGEENGVLSLKSVEVPTPARAQIMVSNEEECRNYCSTGDCNCRGYSFNGSGCYNWLDEDLQGIREEENSDEGLVRDINIIVAASDLKANRRQCDNCGTYTVPYPLSTGPNCGDPDYGALLCNTTTGQLLFLTLNDSYAISSINPDTRTLVIKPEGIDLCWARSANRSDIHLNGSQRFHLTNNNTVLLFNCSTDPTLDCTSSDVCGRYIQEGRAPCFDLNKCCSYVAQDSSHMVGVLRRRCGAYTSIVGLDPSLRTNEWWEGIEIGWDAPPETKSQTSMIISVTVIASVLLLGMVVYCVWRKMIKKKGYTRYSGSFNETFGEDGRKEIDVPFFEFDCILDATEKFSDSNKLGRGGFGPVYKGKLPNGQEIAVKRLSKSSGQGQVEFKNEVLLIAKLQHKNLVRLLGYCIEGDERILLYEYMPNKSLDFHLFDPNRSKLLSWEKRHSMILGIARGLLYLHEDSRLTVIHRDLKTSNVLLDEEMKPKISDFGMARIFGANQIQENTNRIVGTYGYMSPEYASHGLFSVKSDVFSFGVILLEIVSGTKNTLFYHSEQSLSLVGHAWKLWTEGKWMDLMDRNLDGTTDTSEVEKCVHIGLLCVQENTADRPTMSSVVAMLVSETSIPVPKPAAFLSRSFIYSDSPNCSNNEVTISTLECR